MKKTAAVIVTYNRKDKLLRCIDAVLDQTVSEQLDLIVVDNNSTDGTGEAVREYSGVTYFNLRYNSGGAGGFSFGIRKALESGYEFIWLMDDDCIPERDALEQLLLFENANSGKYGFLSSKVLWRDGSLCEMNVQRETLTRDIRCFTDKPVRVEMASFVSLFLPSAIAAEAGLPVREFFIWTDDWEYTRRISRKHTCWAVPASVVIHDTEANTGADISKASDDRVDRFRFLYRKDVYLYRREGVRGFVYEAARLAYHAARIAVSNNSIREKARRLGIMIKGTAEGLRFYPEPERAYIRGDRE